VQASTRKYVAKTTCTGDISHYFVASGAKSCRHVHRVSKKLCKIVFAITFSNFH